MLFNCLVLSTKSLATITISKDENGRKFVKFDQQQFYLNQLIVSLLREYICKTKKIDNSDNMKLWKISNVKMNDIKNRNICTEDYVKTELNGEEMELTELFRNYFKDELDRADS